MESGLNGIREAAPSWRYLLAVLPADDTEAKHATLVVEDLEPLAAAGGSTGQGHARPPPLLSPDRRSPPRELRPELAAPRDPARTAVSAWQLGPVCAAPWRPRRGPPAGRVAAPGGWHPCRGPPAGRAAPL